VQRLKNAIRCPCKVSAAPVRLQTAQR